MRMSCLLVPGWKKLAWVAVSIKGSGTLTVHHGPLVEVQPDWCFEGVWGGSFDAGDFDRTDVVAGSGVRQRGDRVIFVSPGNTVDRLWHVDHRGTLYVSNSLPALLATAELDLVPEYDYARDLATVTQGLHKYVRAFPLSEGATLQLTYFENLSYDGQTIERLPKPNATPELSCFDDYWTYMQATSASIGGNCAASQRQHRIASVVSISRGYDSPTVAVLAKLAGCQQAVTIVTSNSPTRRSDSGAEIAALLDLPCREYTRKLKHDSAEIDIRAGMGLPDDMNMTMFEHDAPLTLLFTGFHGDKVWDRHWHQLTHLERGDHSGSHFTEYRLRQGIIDCPVPFWGIQNIEQILTISTREEMQSWTLGNNYDRPIPRRIVESAGVPRASFGRKKAATTTLKLFRPVDPKLEADFGNFLAARKEGYVPRWREGLSKILDVAYLFLARVPGLRRVKCYEWINPPPANLYFQWANAHLKDEYQSAQQVARR